MLDTQLKFSKSIETLSNSSKWESLAFGWSDLRLCLINSQNEFKRIFFKNKISDRDI